MDLRQKLEFQEVVNKYISENGIYELFQKFTESLIVDKPEDPYGYLIAKLSKPEIQRVFVTGSSGRIRKEVSKELAFLYKAQMISTGDLLREEVEKNGKLAASIMKCWKEGTYVKDSIVLGLLLPELEKQEKLGVNYLLEGAPRTLAQAIALQRAAVIPLKLVVLKSHASVYKSDFIESFSQYAQSDVDYDTASEVAYQEYEIGMNEVIGEYSRQCYEAYAEDDFKDLAEKISKAVPFKES